MANIAFDFLTESFLFDERYINENYWQVSEQELLLELQKYRNHIIKNRDNIINEVTRNKNSLNVSLESVGSLPTEQLLKQIALYMDKIIISDPIFSFTQTKSNMHVPMSQLMGVNPNIEIDKRYLANCVKYMKETTPLVATQFIKYVPVSLIHEPPKELPILYSEDNFSSELSAELYDFFCKKAKVNNVTIKNGSMCYKDTNQLFLGTTIAVDFDEDHIRKGHIYQFIRTEFRDYDKETGKVEMIQYIPDTISQVDFDNWVTNSINRAAIAEFRTTLNEAILAKKMNCMYMAKSNFTSELLSQTVAKENIETDLVNLSMSLELPLLNEISLNDLAKIRCDNGEAFHNFRTELNSKLLGVRGITDSNELKKELENISYEMNQLQVNEVNKEYRKIIKSFGLDATILTGSLVTSFCTGGLTLLGAAGALAKGGIDYIKYLNEVKENNGYFLWNLKRKAK